MTDTIWGEMIPVDGKRPAWLRNETIQWTVRSSQKDFGETDSRNFDLWTKGDWDVISHVKLPADHPYYTVQRHNAQNGTNFTYWPGGENAPDDWDSGCTVLFKDKSTSGGGPWTWETHIWDHPRNIIGYTRRAEPISGTDGPAEWAVTRVIEECGAAEMPSPVVNAFARYIEQHEKPPVDPDVLAVREILAAWNSETSWAVKPLMEGVYDPHPRFLAALSAYRKHRQ